MYTLCSGSQYVLSPLRNGDESPPRRLGRRPPRRRIHERAGADQQFATLGDRGGAPDGGVPELRSLAAHELELRLGGGATRLPVRNGGHDHLPCERECAGTPPDFSQSGALKRSCALMAPIMRPGDRANNALCERERVLPGQRSPNRVHICYGAGIRGLTDFFPCRASQPTSNRRRTSSRGRLRRPASANRACCWTRRCGCCAWRSLKKGPSWRPGATDRRRARPHPATTVNPGDQAEGGS